jgi:hypothetical protein
MHANKREEIKEVYSGDIAAAVNLSAGITQGVNGAVIAGSTSVDNLYTQNGVVLNETVRQQALPNFIEDAIQETTVLTSGVSAEFGRFSGGVINTAHQGGRSHIYRRG